MIHAKGLLKNNFIKNNGVVLQNFRMYSIFFFKKLLTHAIWQCKYHVI